MFSQHHLRQFVRAVLHELFRSKTTYNIVASCILLLVVAAGYFWQESYVSQAAISTVERDAAQADPLARLETVYQSRSFQETLAVRLEDHLPSALASHAERMRYIERHVILSRESSNVMAFRFKGENPESAQKVLSVVIDVLLGKIQPKEDVSTYRTRFAALKAQETELSKVLKDIEEQMADVKAINGIERDRDRVRTITESLQDVSINLDASDAKIDGIRTLLAKENTLHEASERMAQLQAQKTKVTSALEESRTLYAPGSPEVVSLEQELDSVNIEIVTVSEEFPLASKSRVSDDLYEQLRQKLTLEELENASLKSRQASLQRLLAKEQQKTSEGEDQLAIQATLQKRFDDTEKTLLQVRQEQDNVLQAEQRARSAQGRYFVLDAPSLASKYNGLGFIEFLVMGPVLAFGLPFLFASGVVMSDARIRTVRQMANGLPQGVSVMGAIPHYNSPKTARIFRKAILSLILWGVFVLIVYLTVGVIGLKG